ncbi:MAG: CRISPR system precrRNA processing endoribonuclease RAMP protein Cas6 [Crenarchaeota archaeon]|nr:CRISPR system precrRNA processing endoribonuclease RAMP protein Cas6 [Thermoproteota archaeon]
MMFIINVKVNIRPHEDVPLPSVSSRLSKMILIKALESMDSEKALKIVELLRKGSPLTRTPVKPIRVSFIYDEKHPLWEEYERRPIMRAGKRYSFTLTLFDSDNVRERLKIDAGLDVIAELLDNFSGEFRIFKFNRVEVSTESIEAVSEDQLYDYSRHDTAIVQFLTPTFLQYPHHPRIRGYPTRHTLYPQPMLLMLSLVYKWNNLADSHVNIAQALYAPYEIIEVSHSIRPVTLQFRKIRERGFVGWIKYGIDSRSSRRYEEYIKLFNFANYVGVGRSTNIGLGDVKTELKRRGHERERHNS